MPEWKEYPHTRQFWKSVKQKGLEVYGTLEEYTEDWRLRGDERNAHAPCNLHRFQNKTVTRLSCWRSLKRTASKVLIGAPRRGEHPAADGVGGRGVINSRAIEGRMPNLKNPYAYFCLLVKYIYRAYQSRLFREGCSHVK